MHIGIAADHGGFELKVQLITVFKTAGYEVRDCGARELTAGDDYLDFVVPLARRWRGGGVNRGVAICGSGAGACVAANKAPDVRAALITDYFSVHQGVEGDNMNMICLGGLMVGHALARELVKIFLAAEFSGAERHRRRLAKMAELENRETP